MGRWANKFDQPTKKALLADLDPEHAGLFEKAYRALTDSCRTKPKLVWMDLPWNWCFIYPCKSEGLFETAYLVPDPAAPRITTTIRTAFFEQNPILGLPRLLQDSIANGVLINHQTWCEWDLTSPELLDAIGEIITMAIES